MIRPYAGLAAWKWFRYVEAMSALDIDHLLMLEQQGWNSLCRSEGGSFYGNLMTPDAVMVLTNGMILDRSAVVESLNGAPPWGSYAITEPRLIPAGQDSAALVYRASAMRDGEEEPFVALMTSLYRMLEGETKLALYQQTTITS